MKSGRPIAIKILIHFSIPLCDFSRYFLYSLKENKFSFINFPQHLMVFLIIENNIEEEYD